MRTQLFDFLNFYQIDTPDRVYLLRELEEQTRSGPDSPAGLLGLLTEARAHDEETLRLEALWRGQAESEAQYGPEARKLDNEIDRALAGLRRHLRAQVELYPEDHPRRATAASLEERFFPGGMTAVTKVSYTAQHSELGRILKEAENEELREALALLGLSEPMDRLGELWQRFGEALNLTEERVSADELREARSFGLEMLAEIIVAILAARRPGERGMERRLKMLEPIERFNNRKRAYHKSRVRRSAEDPTEVGPELDGDPTEVPEAA